MKLIGKDLYINSEDLRKSGIDENTALTGKKRKSKIWETIKDPTDARMNLYKYEAMAPKYKAMVVEQFGDPYQHLRKQPIKDLVKENVKARTFFNTHTYNGNQSLSPEKVKAYTEAASWLDMIITCNDDKRFVKRELGMSIVDFYTAVKEIIIAESIALPAEYKRLREKMKRYQEEGFAALINGRFGLTNAKKVSDEVAEAVLSKMIGHPSQFDDMYISWQYNDWAAKNNKPSITDRTVCNYRLRLADKIIMEREGQAAYYNKFSRSIIGHRPTSPFLLWESDDNHLDFFFTDWKDTTSHRHFHKLKAIIVTDSYNDYVLGYAIAKEITTDTVKEAYRNALHYVRQITGMMLLPHETKSDRWGIKKLEPFYKTLGNYFKTPVGSKRRGFIEQFFGDPHWKRCAKIDTNNFTGNNITAKNRGINVEELVRNAKDYPAIEDAHQHIHEFFHRLRHMPCGSSKTSPHEKWMAAFQSMDQDRLRIISEIDYLQIVGIVRKGQNTISSRGLDIQINNYQHNYYIPDAYYYSLKGSQVSTVYDPNDFSRILVTDFNSIRFIAKKPEQTQPRALADYATGDRTRLNIELASKEKHVAEVSAFIEKRDEVLDTHDIDVTALLNSGFLLKNDRFAAELQYQRNQLGAPPPPPPASRKAINPLDKM